MPLIMKYVMDMIISTNHYLMNTKASRQNSKIFMKRKAKKPCSAPKPAGLKKVRNLPIIFFNLEKRNFEKKVIAQLKLENGEIISDMKQVNLEIESFYSDLLETKSAGLLSTNFRENFSAFVENLDIPKLSFEESMSLESDLTLGEIKNVLKSFQSNKSPGGDGFSKEFFETFFDLIGTHLLNSYNEAFTKGQLSISQRRGVICLIPKDDSDLTELSNWRPLTLLNVDYKILAKAIGQRIESKLSSLIHSDQTGFIKGRFIGQNVRLLNDIMEYTEAKNLPGILLFIDFRKAFDTIEWNFLHKCIELYNFGPNIRKWISILYNNVESGVMNAGFMTNYFKVSRGVRQGCPLLFMLAVEMLALKIRRDQLSRGIELPNGQNAKISQFADDTTLILEDTTSLRNAMNIVNSFGVLSGLQLNKKKTKALWIGASSKNKIEPLKFQCPKEPIKFLGTYLSHDTAANNSNNFYIKIRKMETKLNIWRSRDLTLFGRTMLAKSLGLSQLIYAASMLSVPETVIQQTQSKLFAFLWMNKRDKIKRQVLFRPLSKGGLSFPCFRTVIKALRLSWISRLLNNTHDTWTAIPNYYFDKHGGLLFLLNCNYNVGKLDRKIPLFYRELLDYFQQLRSNYEDPLKREFILWSNRDINIENKSVFWKAWRDKNVLFVQDLLNNQGNYLSPQEFSDKYNIKVNFLQYYQITSAIPAYLKSCASAHMDLGDLNSICENFDFQLSKDITLNLKKTLCKQFYKLFVDEISTEPTAIKSWRKYCPAVADNWVNCIQNNYKITRDNKLRQFYFKLLHRILVTNKELKRFGITDCDKCVMCSKNDSIEHSFFECESFLKLSDESLQWFNSLHKTNVSLTSLQCFLNLPTPTNNLSDKQTKDLRLLLLHAKQYHYACKTMQKEQDSSEFISKFIIQLEIDI